MHNWRNAVLKETFSMHDAINVLNNESLRIVLVVDESEKLIGTVTDGDIRRALLRNMTLESRLSDLMFSDPSIASLDDSRAKILEQMQARNLLQIPVVDANGKLVGLETLDSFFQKTSFDNPVFLMAGGFGKRLHPLTENTPKPMLKVGSKPILETIIEQFVEAGFKNFYISTHYKAEIVKKYFGDGSPWGISIQYIYEDKPLGTAGALGLLPKDLPKLPIILMNGDLLTKVSFQDLLSFHVDHGGEATMCVREYDVQVPYGVIQADEYRISGIEEKPVHKFFVNAGIYVLEPEIVDNINGKSYLDMPHFLSERIDKNSQINIFPLHEYWLDIGQLDQYEQAQRDSSEIFG